MIDSFTSSSPCRGNVYERDLETNYCKNFSCCGLVLGDLHALLQHYEEAHVRFEQDGSMDNDDDDLIVGGFSDDDGWSTQSDSAPGSPQLDDTRPLCALTPAAALALAAKNTPQALLAAHRKAVGVSLSDIYTEDPLFGPDESVSAFSTSILRASACAPASTSTSALSASSKKRDLAAFSSSIDLSSPLTKRQQASRPMSLFSTTATSAAALTAASLMGDLHSSTTLQTVSAETTTAAALASQDELMSSVTGYLEQAIQRGLLPNCGEVGSPAYLLAVQELLRKRDEIVNMMECIGRPGVAAGDKPYRCLVSGCDKAYKNPNGLKYHNQHGHCSLPGSGDDEKSNVKPYRCTFMDCGKCYKNLNGLKYHIEHSHPNLAAALYANIPGFANLEGGNASQAAITAAAAIAAVKGDNIMMSAINAIIASAANNGLRSQAPLSDQTPDSSPNSSPLLGPVAFQPALTETSFALPGPAPLSIQTNINGTKLTGMLTPLSPTNGSHVSTLTAALAAVSADH